jgi:bifunctional DNase/RNase
VMVEMTVQRVGIDPSRQALVILADQEERRLLPILIGLFEAQSIAMAISGEDIGRPLTHDLLLAVITETGSELERVEITRLADRTFFALLHITRDNETLEIDARPSDAIALALRAEAPIFVAERVLEQAQVIDETVEHDDQDVEKFKDLLGRIDLGEEDGLE